jgi:hypothetical protein
MKFSQRLLIAFFDVYQQPSVRSHIFRIPFYVGSRKAIQESRMTKKDPDFSGSFLFGTFLEWTRNPFRPYRRRHLALLEPFLACQQ